MGNNMRVRPKKILKTVGISVLALLGFIGSAAMILLVAGLWMFSSACDDKYHKVDIKIQEQQKQLNKVSILSDRPTVAIADGNHDCLTGGPDSVKAWSNFKTNDAFASIKADIDSNLAQQAYEPPVAIDFSGGFDKDNDTNYTEKAVFKYTTTRDAPILYVTFKLKEPYPSHVCTDGSRICDPPDLHVLDTAVVRSVEVSNSDFF